MYTPVPPSLPPRPAHQVHRRRWPAGRLRACRASPAPSSCPCSLLALLLALLLLGFGRARARRSHLGGRRHRGRCNTSSAKVNTKTSNAHFSLYCTAISCAALLATSKYLAAQQRSAAEGGGGGRRGTHAWIREGGRMVDGCAGEAWMVDGQPAGGAQWAGHRGLTHRALMPCFPERRPAAPHPAAISKSVIHGGRKEGGGGGRGGGPGWAWAVPGAACSPPPWPPLPAPRAAWRRPWSPCQCACRGRFSAGTLPSPAVPATPRASARSAPAVRTPAARASATTPRRRKHLGPAGGQRHGKAVDISGVPPLPPSPP